MVWYEKMSQIINRNFYTNYIKFLKKKTGQEKLELFWRELYKCSLIWEKKYHTNCRKYQLYGVNGFDMLWFIDEFAFINNNEEYLYILFFLSHFEGRSIREQIELLKDDNVNGNWTDIYMGNDVWEEEEPHAVRINENQFFKEITEYIEKSLRRFKCRSEKYKNDEYGKKIAVQYEELKSHVGILKELKGRKKIIKINEFGNDVSVRYFIKNEKKMYTIRVDEFL